MGAGAFPIPGPNATPFSGSRGEKAKRLLWLCLPMGGREAFHLSKGVAPLGVGGSFPALGPDALPFSWLGNEGAERPPATFPPRPRRPALYGSRGKKEPNVCPGRASSAGSRGSRWAGRVHSTFQAVSSRRAQRMNFR